MYRRAKFVEILHEIRQEMAHEADYDVDLFAEMVRSDCVTVNPGDRKRLRPDDSANSPRPPEGIQIAETPLN